MYGIYANIGGILMVNVTIYSIHGSYGIYIYIFIFIHGRMDHVSISNAFAITAGIIQFDSEGQKLKPTNEHDMSKTIGGFVISTSQKLETTHHPSIEIPFGTGNVQWREEMLIRRI